MNRALVVVYMTIALDAAGIGLVFPILPRLLAEVTHSQAIAPAIGIMAALYALMQFVCAPVLGVLSDNFGRRPVLLMSLACAAINYVIMALAPQLWMLLLGRALAGVTSANVAVATAYITDVSREDQRARRFGLFNAMFGLGFIIGPVLGGWLGDVGLRLPFLAAAALNAGNLGLAWFLLPESHTPERRKIDLAALSPLRPLRRVLSLKGLAPIAAVYFLMSASGEAYGACWALWGFDTFRWDGFRIGLSLGAYGVCQTLMQTFLPGPATRWLGERWTVVLGIGCSSLALIVLSLATQSWIVFAIIPLFALAGVGSPAFQALAARRVDQARQGELQGVLASVVSLASIAAPLGFSTFYFLVQKQWPGAIWLAVAFVDALAIPLVFLGTRSVKPTSSPHSA